MEPKTEVVRLVKGSGVSEAAEWLNEDNRAHWIWPEGAQCQFQGMQGMSREYEVRITLFWETFQ